ncbi:hypothetical protein PoB_002778800 [Plakobranchus ocellatus]|uniref:Uncharacterized protein n=1 Tax=Plakobranchus ocellatus TaxID=259542 RepID=A0AAV4A2A9_9GAST|nr:hypothetical protein PoB_002778800 [Plakobranchus ocellatus]
MCLRNLPLNIHILVLKHFEKDGELQRAAPTATEKIDPVKISSSPERAAIIMPCWAHETALKLSETRTGVVLDGRKE